LVIVDFLSGKIESAETEHYLIKKGCVYNVTKLGNVFLLYKEENNIYWWFSKNTKRDSKKIFPLVGDDLNLYLMPRDIAYPKVQRDIMNLIDAEDMLISMVYTYIEDDYYSIISNSGHDFIDILFKQIKEFNGVDIFFSNKMKKKLDTYTSSKIHPDYDNWAHYGYGGKTAPRIHKLDVYKELASDSTKRSFKINQLLD